eukprot:gene8028-1256_t
MARYFDGSMAFSMLHNSQEEKRTPGSTPLPASGQEIIGLAHL